MEGCVCWRRLVLLVSSVCVCEGVCVMVGLYVRVGGLFVLFCLAVCIGVYLFVIVCVFMGVCE